MSSSEISLTAAQEEALNAFISNIVAHNTENGTLSNPADLRQKMASRFATMSDEEALRSAERNRATREARTPGQQPLQSHAYVSNTSESRDDEGASEYQIPLVLTVSAQDYEEALDVAQYMVQDIEDGGTFVFGDEGTKSLVVAHVLERDNDGQRVLYLPDEREERNEHERPSVVERAPLPVPPPSGLPLIGAGGVVRKGTRSPK